MVNWADDSPASLDAQNQLVYQLNLCLFGVMVWELIVTSKFDFQVITRRITFRWTLLVYFATKYATFFFVFSLFLFNVSTSHEPHPTAHLNCQSLCYFLDFASGIAIAGASTLLMIRALALWQRDRRIVIPVVALNFGQWFVYIHNAFIVRDVWDDVGPGEHGCETVGTSWPWVKAQFIYAMVFDFVVLVLASIALLRLRPGASNLWGILFVDGLGFFLLAFASYLTCTIISFLKVNLVLTWMVSNPATVFVAILACRSFVRVYMSKPQQGSDDLQTSGSQATTGTGFQFNFKLAQSTYPPATSAGVVTLGADSIFPPGSEPPSIRDAPDMAPSFTEVPVIRVERPSTTVP